MTWVFYQSLLLTKARKQAWEKKLPFWISVRSWAESMIIKLLHEIPIYFGQLAVHIFSLRWEQFTVFVKQREYTLQLGRKIGNLRCCACILPMMIVLPGNKSLVSSLTTSSFVNHFHPYISMHLLHTVPYTFPKVLMRRICFIIQSFSKWWPFPLFSLP